MRDVLDALVAVFWHAVAIVIAIGVYGIWMFCALASPLPGILLGWIPGVLIATGFVSGIMLLRRGATRLRREGDR
jgi:hypothetical protein